MPFKSHSPDREQSGPDKAAPSKTMSVPEAGYYYFGLSKNGSYDAAARGEIPFFQVGRLKRVSVAKMERMMEEGARVPPLPPSIETPVKAVAKKPATPSKYPRSTAVRRRAPALADAS
jgi:hypothetical protein